MRPLLLLLSLAAASVPVVQQPPRRSGRVDAAVRGVQPSVVKIFGLKGFRGVYGYRTGILVDKSGLVLTRGSVTLDEAPQIWCHLNDGRRFLGRIVREDRRSKMVLLRLEAKPKDRFPVAPLGSSASVVAGDFVLLIGNAYEVAEGDERCAVNLGVVTGVERVDLREGVNDLSYDRPVILHDAMNNPGDYGGPLVDLEGKVIGVSGMLVESTTTNVQLSYAIPIDDLKPFIRDTLENPDASRYYNPRPRGAETPEEHAGPGYHGIRVLKGGINHATPAYVDRVVPGSPAEKAGIRPDDLILRVNRTEIHTWRGFDDLMKNFAAGDTVRLTIKRGDKILSFDVTLGEDSGK